MEVRLGSVYINKTNILAQSFVTGFYFGRKILLVCASSRTFS